MPQARKEVGGGAGSRKIAEEIGALLHDPIVARAKRTMPEMEVEPTKFFGGPKAIRVFGVALEKLLAIHHVLPSPAGASALCRTVRTFPGRTRRKRLRSWEPAGLTRVCGGCSRTRKGGPRAALVDLSCASDRAGRATPASAR